ncbi:MAG: serpin family protein [Bacteroidetes bacterium]|nr:MAG: serpin family protein [Bacteroidota bacterium]
MTRKILLALAIMVVGLSSCRSLKTNDTETISEPAGSGDGRFVGHVPSEDKTNNNTMTTETEQFNNMLHNMNDFSLEFFRKLSKNNSSESMAFSPASLNMAMAIVYSGAREETRQQISNLFGFDPQHSVFHPAYHAYFSELKEISKDTLVDFNLANRVFLEQSYPVLSQYISDVEKWHDGAFEKTDFRNNPRLAENRINSWVEDFTRDRIKDLIPSGSLSDLTRLVLVNAIYIKSDWKFPFEKEMTEEKMFRTISGDEVLRDFMIQRQSGIPWYEGEDFTAMELPYTTPDLSLILIKPNDKSVTDITRYIPDADTYNKMIREFRQEEVEMEIPSFKLETALSLTEPLQEAGIEEAFDERADFSGISGERDLHISAVLQKVFFEIDEKGSEAAAATAVIVVTTSMPAYPPDFQPKSFIADRPFIFILKENKFNTPLFTGQIVK